MRIMKLSLVAFVLGCCTNVLAADNIADAFKNGSVKGQLKVWYWDRDIDNAGSTKSSSIFNTALELGYLTDSYYNFKFGATFQANATPFASDEAKSMYVNEEYASGSILSEAFIDYAANDFDIKVGRQYITSPLISGNFARINRESFEGVSLMNKSFKNTDLFAHFIQKFQGRTSSVSRDGVGDAPKFRKKIVLGGAGSYSYEFDGAYAFGFKNRSINNLQITGQYLNVQDVGNNSLSPTASDDLSVYYSELNYTLPVNDYKFGIDLRYRKSQTGEKLDSLNWEGDISEIRLSASGFAGFGFDVAYSTVSDSDRAIVGIGLGASTYTFPLIRGPYVYTTQAGTDSYSYTLKYNFAKAGVQGLTGQLKYVTANRDDNYGNKADYKGFGGALLYKIPQLKNVTANLVYFSLDEKIADNKTDEFWLKLSYSF
ncbi:porin [Halarcobacter ebronensis]|uniref:Porin n=1 Tax=Halarcobacter ebronensis TaxID=1462615 RepID=A0A4Q0Y9P0_9BACT|nr:OprD family outer membrane porin [Halarcobacter ebronensis]RXJ66946.1 porin [Halarcobacter ebronensis]